MPPLKKPSLAALTLVLIASVFLATPQIVKAQSTSSEKAKLVRTLSLSAVGAVNTKPDMASISTGIETGAVQARDALDDNSEIMARMMKSLKEAGLEDRDNTTTQFNIQPRYQHFKNGRPAKVIGYRVTNSLRITTRNLDELGPILDRLVTLGSNRISGIQFGLNDRDTSLDQARKEAMRQVLDKAELYARAANVTLGQITSIHEQTSNVSPRALSYRKKRSMAAVPIAPGQHTSRVTVHVKWALVE